MSRRGCGGCGCCPACRLAQTVAREGRAPLTERELERGGAARWLLGGAR